MSEPEDKINEVLHSTSGSLWLRQGLRSALKRDPCEAAADAETMAWLLKMRWEEMKEKGVTK